MLCICHGRRFGSGPRPVGQIEVKGKIYCWFWRRAFFSDERKFESCNGGRDPAEVSDPIFIESVTGYGEMRIYDDKLAR